MNMPEDSLARWQDVLVIAVNLGLMVAIGVYCARKTRSADAYFLANRNMPGWVVAVSMMATVISSVSFLAIPGSTFQDDWRFMPGHALYFIPAIVGYAVFMPFFAAATYGQPTSTWNVGSAPGRDCTALLRFSFITCFGSASFCTRSAYRFKE